MEKDVTADVKVSSWNAFGSDQRECRKGYVMHELDCRGLRCPLPIVKISQTTKKMAEGESLRVLATDKAFRADLMAWLEMTGNELVEFGVAEDAQCAILRLN